MRAIFAHSTSASWILALSTIVCGAQSGNGTGFGAVNEFPMTSEGLVIRRHVEAGKPFTVAGPQGILVGEQQGTFEAWLLPVKLLSHFTIEATVADYPVPIDLNSVAREIEVRPDRTIITYSHIAVTVRQIMFAPEDVGPGTGAIVLFQVDAVRPVDLTFRFTGEMRRMWPAPGGGSPSAEWVSGAAGPSGGATAGFYVLHTDFPDFAGAVAMPGATPGMMAPYQERPQTHPLEFRLHVDPNTGRGKLYPLLMAAAWTPETATNDALREQLLELNDRLPEIYKAHAARYRAQAENLTSIETPDAGLNDDFAWAETSINQLRAKAQPGGELGLVAGYYTSGDSARPGFGWFFGRDTLYTLYAINSYGDFDLSRAALEFLMKRQRADGKIMHEYSQTASLVAWSSLPYEYAAADSTPLFLTAMLDYVRSSGDTAFLQSHRDVVMRAWQFEISNDADGDGIYDNSQGTGWVESWPPGMPLQEVYLALLDQQASAAMGELAALLGDNATAAIARDRARKLRSEIEQEYYLAATGRYAFSRGDRGGSPTTLDQTETVFPAIAWWNAGSGYDPGLAHPELSLSRWASPTFATDWGLRDLAETESLYDPISYHQGSVWPLFTGWEAMAQYRGGNPVAGFQSTMQNAGLTTAQDLGAVTELLSGAFFEPFGRSTSHQLWSSAMVVTPVLRGLFGLDVDAIAGSIHVTPRLPADWEAAEVRRLHVGASVVDVQYHRDGADMVVALKSISGPPLRLTGAPDGLTMRVPLPPIEVAVEHSLPLPGSRTSQLKVIAEKISGRSLRLDLEGMAETEAHLKLRQNHPGLKLYAEGAEIAADSLLVRFPSGTGYVKQTVTVRW